MRQALEQAHLAFTNGEVPIGAVLLHNNQILATAHNQPIGLSDPCGHAEILAIRKACSTQGNYRLAGATLFVTLQPCLMCLGAIFHARIGRVVVGAKQSRFNQDLPAALKLYEQSEGWHPCNFEIGCLESESEALLTSFFAAKRQRRDQNIAQLKTLLDLPNVNKETIQHLQTLGIHSAQDILKPGLESTQSLFAQQVLLLHSENNPQQAAIFRSLCDYLDGEPTRSWKTYLDNA